MPDTMPIANFMDLPFFTGDDADFSLENWICNIKLAHDINRWDVQTTSRFAVARLRGKAGRKAEKLMDTTFESLDALIDELRALFRDKSNSAARLREAYQHGQRAFESIEDWGKRVREIIEDNMGRPFQERQAIQLFTDLLRDGNVSLQLKMNAPATLKLAISQADQYAKMREQAFSGKGNPDQPAGGAFAATATNNYNNLAEPMEIDQITRRSNAQTNTQSRYRSFNAGRQHQASQSQPRKIDCFYCKADDHFVRDCPLKREHEEYARRAQQNIDDLRRRRERKPRGRRQANPGSRGGRVQEICDLMDRLQVLQEEEAESIDRDSEPEDIPEDETITENQPQEGQDFQ